MIWLYILQNIQHCVKYNQKFQNLNLRKCKFKDRNGGLVQLMSHPVILYM